MNILIAATPLTGHVNPLLTLGRLLADRGDRITVVTDPAFMAKVEAAGFAFVPCPDHGAASYLEPELPPGPERWTHEFARRFIDPMPAQAALLRDLIVDEAPDLIIAGSMFLGVLPLLQSDEPRPPIIVVNISVLFLDRPDGAPLGLGLPPARNEDDRMRYAAIAARVDEGFVQPVRAYADRRLAALGLPPLPASLTQSIVELPDAFLQQGVPGFEFDLWDLPPNVRFVGLLPLSGGSTPRPSWWADLDGGKTVVLVTQGTLANDDFGQLLGPTLTALADCDDLLVVATTGGRPVEALGVPLPANARIAPFLPFDALFPKVDVLVTNGGYGSVLQSLAAGVPIVAAGRTEDKAEVAARIDWSGVGIDLKTSTPDAGALAEAIGRVIADQGFRRRAEAMASAFGALDAGREIARTVDDLVAASLATTPKAARVPVRRPVNRIVATPLGGARWAPWSISPTAGVVARWSR